MPHKLPSPRLCLLLSLAALSGCGRNGRPAETKGAAAAPPLLKVGFHLDWYPTAEHGGYFQALVKGYYREAGLDVTIIPGGGASPSTHLIAVGTGRAALAMGRGDDVIRFAVNEGVPLMIVGAQMQHDPQAIMVHAESPVKSFRDLDGKSVMANPGSNWFAFVQQRYGVKFSLVPMDYGLARFMADKNFIQQCFISSEPFFAERAGAKVRTLLIATAGYDPYRTIFTNRSFAKEHPEAVTAFLAASNRGWREFLHGDNAAARARIQAENNTQTPDIMDYSIAAMKRYHLVEGDPAKGERIGLITPERIKALVRTLVELKALDAAPPLEKFVRFDLLPPEPGPAKN